MVSVAALEVQLAAPPSPRKVSSVARMMQLTPAGKPTHRAIFRKFNMTSGPSEQQPGVGKTFPVYKPHPRNRIRGYTEIAYGVSPTFRIRAQGFVGRARKKLLFSYLYRRVWMGTEWRHPNGRGRSGYAG